MLITTTTDQHGDMVAHKAGCKHLEKLTPYSDLNATFEAASATDVAGYVWADQIAEAGAAAAEYLDYMDFAPCLHALPTQLVA
jgi:hypothetical protein